MNNTGGVYIYLIMKDDAFHRVDAPLHDRITACSAFMNLEAAEAEVKRLNDLCRESVRYYLKTSWLFTSDNSAHEQEIEEFNEYPIEHREIYKRLNTVITWVNKQIRLGRK
jgi:hypothetical protein